MYYKCCASEIIPTFKYLLPCKQGQLFLLNDILLTVSINSVICIQYKENDNGARIWTPSLVNRGFYKPKDILWRWQKGPVICSVKIVGYCHEVLGQHNIGASYSLTVIGRGC